MGLDSRDYMREVPIYRRLLGLDTASGGSGGGGGRPPTTFADPPQEPSWWGSMSSGHHRRPTRTRPWAWFLLGVIVTLAIVSYAVTGNVPSTLADAFDRGGTATTSQPPTAFPPGTTAVVDGMPAVGRPLRIPIGGRESVTVGTSITVEGRTPTRRGGVVVVRMRREGGVWRTLRRTRAAGDGSYRVSYRIWNPGRTQVRIVFPGGSFAYKWYRVT